MKLLPIAKALGLFCLLALGGWQTFMAAGPPSSYTGLVATRGQVEASIDTGNKYANSRSFHISRGAISQIKIMLPCWYSNNGENGSTGAITYQSSIEYPAGTDDGDFKFSASSSGSCNNSNLTSDLLTLSTQIPDNTTFYVRIFQDAHLSAGILYGYPTSAYNPGGDGIEVSATSIASKTTGGTITASGTPIFPLALIGSTTLPSVALLGDSKNVGIATTGNASGDNGSLAPSIGPYFAYTSLGSPGESCFQASAVPFGGAKSFILRADVAPYVTDLVSEYGTNDLYTSQSLANIKLALPACWALLGSIKAYQITITPVTDSSNAYADSAGQSAPSGHADFAPLGATSIWGQLNTWILTTPSGLTAPFDLANTVQPVANDGLWISQATVPGGPYTGDGIHELQAGALVEKNSGVINHAAITR